MSEIMRGKPEDFEHRDGATFLVPPPCRLCADLHYAPVMAETVEGQKWIFVCKNMPKCGKVKQGKR